MCFTGLNGMGKTNLLDSIFYLSTGKSAFTNIDSQNILKGHKYFTIDGTFSVETKADQIFCGFTQGRKKVLKNNNVEYEKLIHHYGQYPVVMVAPTDLALVTEGSEERRKFIDSSISIFNKTYLSQLVKYNQVLQQRNSLLKHAKENAKLNLPLLQIYNSQIEEYANVIYPIRKSFIKDLEPIFNAFVNEINNNQEQLELDFTSQLDHKKLSDLFDENFDRERILGRTECGIHKDKLNFKINGELLKKFGSQGQQKSYVLAIKLAQAKLTEIKTGKKSILLLDDLFDRLDDQRAAKLLELAHKTFQQLFITDTSKLRLQKALQNANKQAQFFNVENGEVNGEE